MPSAPTYVGNTAMKAGNAVNTLTDSYISMNVDDIMFLQAQAEGTTYDFADPSGFTLIGSFENADNQYGAFWWKRVVGDEGVTFTVDRTSSSGLMSCTMSVWRGARASWTPFSYEGPYYAYYKNCGSSAITPPEDYCRLICLISVEDNVSVGDMSGDYAEDFDYNSSAGNGQAFACDSYGQTTATADISQIASLGLVNKYWCTLTVALFPNLATWPPQTNGVLGKNIASVNGVLAYNIASINGVSS